MEQRGMKKVFKPILEGEKDLSKGNQTTLNKYKQKIKLISFICCLLRLRSRSTSSDWSEHLLAFFINEKPSKKSLSAPTKTRLILNMSI